MKLSKEQWDQIEARYRAGVGGIRAVAKEFGISHVAILRRAKKYGWIANEIKGEVAAAVVEARTNPPKEEPENTQEKVTVEPPKKSPRKKKVTKREKVTGPMPRERAVEIAATAALVSLERVDRLIFEAAQHSQSLSDTLHAVKNKHVDPEAGGHAAILLATDGYLMGLKVLIDSADKLQRMTHAQIGFGEARKDKNDGEKILDLTAVDVTELHLLERTLQVITKG